VNAIFYFAKCLPVFFLSSHTPDNSLAPSLVLLSLRNRISAKNNTAQVVCRARRLVRYAIRFGKLMSSGTKRIAETARARPSVPGKLVRNMYYGRYVLRTYTPHKGRVAISDEAYRCPSAANVDCCCCCNRRAVLEPLKNPSKLSGANSTRSGRVYIYLHVYGSSANESLLNRFTVVTTDDNAQSENVRSRVRFETIRYENKKKRSVRMSTRRF